MSHRDKAASAKSLGVLRVLSGSKDSAHAPLEPASMRVASRRIRRTSRMAAQTITLLAEKGGVGRTTLTVNLAGALAREGRRVLLVDMEGQASLSKLFLGPQAVEQLPVNRLVAALFDEAADALPEQIIQRTRSERIHVAPSSGILFRYEQGEPLSKGMLAFALRDFLVEVQDQYDYILVDTPPMIRGLLGVSAVLAADAVITPIEPEPFAVQAVVQVHSLLMALQEALRQAGIPPAFRHLGVVVTKKDRKALHKATELMLRNNYGSQVFETVIRDLAAYADANAAQLPVTEFVPKAKGAQAKALEASAEVLQLTAEIQGRLAGQQTTKKTKTRRVA